MFKDRVNFVGEIWDALLCGLIPFLLSKSSHDLTYTGRPSATVIETHLRPDFRLNEKLKQVLYSAVHK